MTDQEAKGEAMKASLRILASSAKSKIKLKTKLLDKGFEEAIVDSVISDLESGGLINDEAFGQSVFEQFSEIRPSGKRRIEFEMKKRGVPQSVREELLEKYEPQREAESALEIAASKWHALESQEMIQRKRKTYDFLVRRGFDFQIARETIEKLEHGNQEEF